MAHTMQIAIDLRFDNSATEITDSVRAYVVDAIAAAVEKAKQEGTITPDESNAYLLYWSVRECSPA